MRGPADELAVREGCWFDEEAGRLICVFIETFCCQSHGRWRGKPLSLLPWQRDLIMRLFGWKRRDGTRRYRTCYVEVAKKNGKSTLVSALVIALLLLDGEGAPEIYLNARTKAQAEIIYKESERMVRASPALSRRLKPKPSQGRIVWPAGDGVIIANSAESESKDGLNPSGVVFDELHRQKDRALWSVFEYACEAREQPLTLSITTAGEAETGIWFEQREKSERVNAGLDPDWTHLGVVYRCLPTDDLDDPEVWRKANPSLGYTLSEDEFRRKWEDAKRNPHRLPSFKRLRFNIITREEVAFVSLAVWDDPAVEPPRTPAELAGDPCYGGLDLSSVDDLTAFVLLFGDPTNGFDLVCRFWLPEDSIIELERKHKVPYRAWAELGLITLTPGESIDYAFVRAEVLKLTRGEDLRLLLADPCNADQLLKQLGQDDGLNVEAIRQGTYSLNSPTKELLRLILARKVRHGGHPILRWMVGNAVAIKDENDNTRLAKRRSRGKIDGLAATVNALAAALSEHAAGSVYDSRGLITL